MGKLLLIILVLLLLVTGALAFSTKISTGISYINGSLGIGTQTPSSELEVVGTVTATSFSGTINGDDIVDGSIDASELAPDSVGSSELADSAIVVTAYSGETLNGASQSFPIGTHDVCFLTRVAVNDGGAGDGDCHIFGTDLVIGSSTGGGTKCTARCLDW